MKRKLFALLFSLSTLALTAATLEWTAVWDSDEDPAAVEFDTVIIGRVSDASISPWKDDIYIGYQAASELAGNKAWSTSITFEDGVYYFQRGIVEVKDFDDVGDGYLYYMELKAGDGMVAYSGFYSYDSLVFAKVPSSEEWRVETFHAVPEPSSGLLLLIGGALVGLRRKRRAA